jgi:hypothetical protein
MLAPSTTICTSSSSTGHSSQKVPPLLSVLQPSPNLAILAISTFTSLIYLPCLNVVLHSGLRISCAATCGQIRACPVLLRLSLLQTHLRRVDSRSRVSRTTLHVCIPSVNCHCISLNITINRLPSHFTRMGPTAGGQLDSRNDLERVPTPTRARGIRDVHKKMAVSLCLCRCRICERLHHLPHVDLCSRCSCPCSQLLTIDAHQVM